MSWLDAVAFVGGPTNGCRRKPNGKRPREAPIGEPIHGATTGTLIRLTAQVIGPGKRSNSPITQWEAFWLKGEGAAISQRKGSERGEILTLPVGSFPSGASPYGALDMAGNAAEWVQDWYNPNHYRSAGLTNPQGQSGAPIKPCAEGPGSNRRSACGPPTAVGHHGQPTFRNRISLRSR